MTAQNSPDLIVGIDLGTTNSLVSVVESGFPIVLADPEGHRLLPSVVSFLRDGSVLTGFPAVRNRLLNREQTFSSIKRVIGRRFDELNREEMATLPFPLQMGPGGSVRIPLGDGSEKSPEEISAEILKQLKTTAETALEREIDHAVITVPAYFSHAQREATRIAAQLAGWTVERIINEPTAAALAYGLNQGADGQVIAVYDLGGGTFDLSILRLEEGLFEVIATSGDTRLGGDDIDLSVAHWLRGEMGLENIDLSSTQELTLLLEARKAKESLSDRHETSVTLPFFHGERSFEVSLSRDILESLTLPFLEKTRQIGRRAILEAEHKGVAKIDRLILVGGSTRMPLVRAKLEEWFGLQPDLTQHPDEAIAIGAGIQAGILCGRIRQVVLVDVIPLSLGIETIGGLMNVIVPRNTSIPAKAGEMFTNAVANQPSMAVRILQGEREMAKDNWLLGEITFPFRPGPKGSARVGVQFEIDENGLLTVLARDTQTGTDHILKIENSAVDVTDDAVENMISQSVEHAFEDMNQRIRTETQLKSEELLPAVHTALALAGNLLTAEESEKIAAAALRVKSLLQSEKIDLTELKKANADLDDQTQHLAALLVEKALDDAFRGREQ